MHYLDQVEWRVVYASLSQKISDHSPYPIVCLVKQSFVRSSFASSSIPLFFRVMAPSFLLQEAVLDPLYFLTYQHVCRAMVLAKIVAANFTVLYVVAILLLGTCDNFAPVAVYQGYTHSGSYILYCNLYRILALVIPRPSGATRPQPSSVYHPYTPQRRGITNIYAG